MKYISIILAEKIISISEESGAKTTEKLASLEVAKAVVPFLSGGVLCPDTPDEDAQ
jgi:hypothetical protein